MSKAEAINQILKNHDILSMVREQAYRLANSGAIDFSDERGLAPAKTCVCIALENVASQFFPVSEENIKDAKNLRKF